MINGFVLENMHLCGGGVFQYIAEMLCGDRNCAASLTKDNLLTASKRMRHIQKYFWPEEPARQLRFAFDNT